MVYTPGHQVITDTHTNGSFGHNGAYPHPDVEETFPHIPPRTDMEIQQQLYMPSYLTAIDVHISRQGRLAAVRCEEQLNDDTSVRRGTVVPDILIALDVDENIIQQRNGYSIREIGKPPEFVMEIAHENSDQPELTSKVNRYQALGVQECWSFDTTGGTNFGAGLQGRDLVNGLYRDIPIRQDANGNQRGYSAVLGLAVCWEQGQLRFFNGATGEYLLTHAEEIQRADAAEQRAQAESQRATTAERQAQAESQRATTSEQENAKMRERLAELGVTLD